MSIINKLKLVSSVQVRNVPPAIARRNKLCAKIEEQLLLATAKNEGKLYSPMRIKTITNEQGERVKVQVPKRVKEWYWTSQTGKINLAVRYGSKVLELAKGKNAIEIADNNELVDVLTQLKSAVVSGELDTAIENASSAVKANFK